MAQESRNQENTLDTFPLEHAFYDGATFVANDLISSYLLELNNVRHESTELLTILKKELEIEAISRLQKSLAQKMGLMEELLNLPYEEE